MIRQATTPNRAGLQALPGVSMRRGTPTVGTGAPGRFAGLYTLNNIWVRRGVAATAAAFVPIALDPWNTTAAADPNPGVTLNPWGTTEAP